LRAQKIIETLKYDIGGKRGKASRKSERGNRNAQVTAYFLPRSALRSLRWGCSLVFLSETTRLGCVRSSACERSRKVRPVHNACPAPGSTFAALAQASAGSPRRCAPFTNPSPVSKWQKGRLRKPSVPFPRPFGHFAGHARPFRPPSAGLLPPSTAFLRACLAFTRPSIPLSTTVDGLSTTVAGDSTGLRTPKRRP